MQASGRQIALMLLAGAPDLEALKRVWSGLNPKYQRDPIVAKLKDELKAEMEKRGE